MSTTSQRAYTPSKGTQSEDIDIKSASLAPTSQYSRLKDMKRTTKTSLTPKKKRSEVEITNVGLISDTHVPTRAKVIPVQVFEVFQNVDFIVHAGDLVQLEVLDDLRQIAPVYAVHGNMDGLTVQKKLPAMHKLKVYGWIIGVTHDPGTAYRRNRMRQIAAENDLDVLVYGHTHRPNVKWENNVLYINPGTPTNPIPPFITKSTVSILKITPQRLEPETISIKK